MSPALQTIRSTYLKLVDENVLARLEYVWVVREELEAKDEQVVEIERVSLAQGGFILDVQLRSAVMQRDLTSATTLSVSVEEDTVCCAARSAIASGDSPRDLALEMSESTARSLSDMRAPSRRSFC
jgi:hypothetical protein